MDGIKLDARVEGDALTSIRNAGAGFLSDLAKQAEREGVSFELTGAEARDSGAGFIQDVLKEVEVAPAVVSGLDPATAEANAVAEVIVTINGTGFYPQSVVLVDGAVAAGSYVSDTQMLVTIPTTVVGSVSVAVRNGEQVSEAIAFEVTEPPVEPEE